MENKDESVALCPICDQEPLYAWTDTHGVGQCRCGAPFRLYHYDDHNKRIEKQPQLLVSPEWIDRCREFWKKTRRPMPGGHSFPGGYERATAEDMIAWEQFCDSKLATL